MKKTLYFLLLFGLGLEVNAQNLNLDYQPIEFTGVIPARFLRDLKDVSVKEIKTADEALNKKEKDEFYITSNNQLFSLFKSGNVYFNDFISDYVNKVAKEVIKNEDSEIVKNLSFNVTKFPIANAFCWRNGDIFVNIELFNYIDNEAQLAYILCHEIQHFKNQHSLNFYKKDIELSKQKKKKKNRDYKKVFKGNDDLIKEIERMSYSKEQEFEADLEGLALFLKSDYNPKEAIGALAALKKINIPNQIITIDLKIFNTEEYEIDSSKIWKKGTTDTLEIEELKKEDEEELSTHPELEKRIEKVEASLENKSGENFIVSKQVFNKIQSVVDFEKVNFLYDKNFFHHTISTSMELLNQYPENKFLQTKIAESLYQILLLNKLGSSSEEKDIKITNQTAYLAKYFDNISSKKFETLTSSYINNLSKKYTEDKDIAIVYGKTLLVLNKKPQAKSIFKSFNDKENKNYNYAKSKENIR